MKRDYSAKELVEQSAGDTVVLERTTKAAAAECFWRIREQEDDYERYILAGYDND